MSKYSHFRAKNQVIFGQETSAPQTKFVPYAYVCVVIRSTIERLYKAMVSWSDLFFLRKIDEKLSYVVRDAEKSSGPCTIFLSILLWNGVSLKTTSGYIALYIVVLWDNYKTNLHFIFVWTTEWKITWKCQNFLAYLYNRPFKSRDMCAHYRTWWYQQCITQKLV